MKKSPSIDDIKAQSMLNAKLAKGQRERIEQKKFRNNVEITQHHHATIPTGSTIKTNGSKKGSNAIINGGGTVAVPPDTTIRKCIIFVLHYLSLCIPISQTAIKLGNDRSTDRSVNRPIYWFCGKIFADIANAYQYRPIRRPISVANQ